MPTIRTTTATLKNACAIRIGAHPRSTPSGRIARNASATTTVGSTNGTTTSAPTRLASAESVAAEHVRRGERDAIVSTVDASACQTVNHTTSRVSGSVRTSSGESPAPAQPALDDGRERVEEEQREERERDAVRRAPARRGRSREPRCPSTRPPSARGSPRSPRAGARAGAPARRRTARTPAGAPRRGEPGTRTSAAGCPPGSASRA